MSILGIPVFADLSVESFAALIALYFLSFVVKGMFGLGAQPPLVIFGALIVDPHHAVLLSVVSNAISQLQFIPESIRNGDRPVVRGLVLGYLPSIALGVWLFGRLDTSGLSLVLGVVLTAVIAAEGFSVFRRWEGSIRAHPRRVGTVMASVSGLLAGLTGAAGVILTSLYVKILCPEARTFRATILAVATVIMVWRMAMLGVGGFIGLPLLLECLVLAPCSVLGGFVGSKLFGRLPRERFFWAFRIVLVVAALNLVFKGLKDLMGGFA
ncbi:MAG: sulfite exporter TauE/SafE family protein [Rhodospirillales bacterium]|nr:sulfite exporter TauE/SafE family protein [Rhodospirillales bacterium]